jgi:drug/metabolite transporter (DMT)-like permease
MGFEKDDAHIVIPLDGDVTEDKPEKPKPTSGEFYPSMSGYFWLLCWFLLNVGLTLMNKSLFQFSKFKFPVALSLVHMIFSALCSMITLKTQGINQQQFQRKDQISIMLFSVLFCANIMVGNLCLNYVSVSLVQVVRSTIPGITLFLSMIILSKTYERVYFYTIGLVVFGVGLASYGEVEFHYVGFLWTIVVCFLSSLKSVMSAKFLVGSLKLHEFDLLQRMSTYAIPQLLFFSVILERNEIIEWWGANGGMTFALLLSMNGIMAFLLNWCNFMTTKKTSALTVTVAGNVKHIVTIAFSILIFNTPVSTTNFVGILVTVIGAALYSYLEYKAKQPK